MLTYFIFLCKALILSALDLAVLAILYEPFLILSRCFYYAVLARGTSLAFICTAGLCALLPTFVLTGTFGADLVVMVPLGIILYQVSRFIEISLFWRFSMVALCLFLHAFIMEYWWIGMPFSVRSLLFHAFIGVGLL